MDSAELKAIQTPLKERYRETPESAVVTLRAVGSVDDQAIACKVETGRALAIAGLHPATGGSGAELCSGDMLLEALVACAGVTLKAVATALEFKLDGGTVSAEGDLDFRGTLGVAGAAVVELQRGGDGLQSDPGARDERLEARVPEHSSARLLWPGEGRRSPARGRSRPCRRSPFDGSDSPKHHRARFPAHSRDCCLSRRLLSP